MLRRLFAMVVGFHLQGACGVRCGDLTNNGVQFFLVVIYLILCTFCNYYAAINFKRAPIKTSNGKKDKMCFLNAKSCAR